MTRANRSLRSSIGISARRDIAAPGVHRSGWTRRAARPAAKRQRSRAARPRRDRSESAADRSHAAPAAAPRSESATRNRRSRRRLIPIRTTRTVSRRKSIRMPSTISSGSPAGNGLRTLQLEPEKADSKEPRKDQVLQLVAPYGKDDVKVIFATPDLHLESAVFRRCTDALPDADDQ